MNKEEFIEKLRLETIMDYATSKCLVEIILNYTGTIEKALDIYTYEGFKALITYRNQLGYGIR